jgi:hypothetical protein
VTKANNAQAAMMPQPVSASRMGRRLREAGEVDAVIVLSPFFMKILCYGLRTSLSNVAMSIRRQGYKHFRVKQLIKGALKRII